MSRSAWVTHISAVTLTQITTKAPNVVRKIYRPTDPIRLRVPSWQQKSAAAGPRRPHADNGNWPLSRPCFDRPTKWLGQGKAFEYAQQNVNSGSLPKGHRVLPKRGRIR